MARTVASEAKRRGGPASEDSPVPELPKELWLLIYRFVGTRLEDLGKLRLLSQSHAKPVKCLQYQVAVSAHFDKRTEQRKAAWLRDRNDPELREVHRIARKDARMKAHAADARAKLVVVAMSRKYKDEVGAQRDERLQFYELQLNTLRELRDKMAPEEAWFL